MRDQRTLSSIAKELCHYHTLPEKTPPIARQTNDVKVGEHADERIDEDIEIPVQNKKAVLDKVDDMQTLNESNKASEPSYSDFF